MHTPYTSLFVLFFASFSIPSHAGLLSDIINRAASEAGISPSNQRVVEQAIKSATEKPASENSPTKPTVEKTSVPQLEAQTEFSDFAGNATGPALNDARGALMPLHFEIRQSVLPAAQAKIMKGKVDTVLELLRQTPALSTLQGFSINQHIFLHPTQASPAAGAEGYLLVRRIDPAKSKVDKASGALQGIGEGPDITVQVNDQAALFGYAVGKDKHGDYFQIAARPKLLQGFPVYEQRGSDVVVIAKPGRIPYINISKQRFLDGLIAEDLKQAEQLRKQLATTKDAAGRAEIGKYIPQWENKAAEKQAALDAMPESERQAPTCPSNNHKRGLFADCNEPGTVYYVTFNPDYFDASKPKASIQLITIDVVGKAFLNDKTLGTLVRQAVGELDLKALQGKLD